MKNLAIGATLIALVAPCAYGQSRSAAYVAVGAGAVMQPSEFSVRSGVGFALTGAVGHEASQQVAFEARIAFDAFAAPTPFISPGGCFGANPCNLPSASPVRITTLGGDVVLSNPSEGVTPFVVAGGGVGYITESPERGSDARPYAEGGAGVARRLGGHVWSVDARVQLTTAASELPRWNVPVTLGVRF